MMSRALMAGMTDYSHQSFDDMVADLQNWVKNLTQVCETLEKSESQLEVNDYWKKVSYNVQGYFGYSSKFFKTSIEDIGSILSDFAYEIQANHVNRIQSLAQTANKLNGDFAKEWHKDPWDEKKEYENPNFLIVEKMYAEVCDMAADMIDLSNLAARLEDFIGKKGKQNREVTQIQETTELHLFVDQTRIDELRAIKSPNFDLTKLIGLCEELNTCYMNKCYLATIMIERAILDHVPPIFEYKTFIEVANNYRGSKSLKKSLNTLQETARNIADNFLHLPIRDKETLPNKTQVNFSNDMDMLLSEIVRILK